MLRLRTRSVGLATLLVLALAGCGPAASPSGSAGPSASEGVASGGAASGAPSATVGAPTPLVVGLGYIPSVQFAQFYLADRAGYYREAGLSVTLQNKIDPDLVTLVGQGTIDIGEADGTSVVPAGSQGIPIRYVSTIYGTNPAIVFAKASSGIKTAADLKGKRIGIPGKYGASWIMLQALLADAGLTPADVTIVPYPDYGQGVAVEQGAVDAATGYANNEPLALERAGQPVVVLSVPSATPLPGPGLIVSTSTLASKRAALEAFVLATLRAMREIAADPQVGLDAAVAAVPELGKDPALQLSILRATIATWASPTDATIPYGTIDTAGWAKTIGFMTTLGLVPNPVTVDALVTSELLPK